MRLSFNRSHGDVALVKLHMCQSSTVNSTWLYRESAEFWTCWHCYVESDGIISTGVLIVGLSRIRGKHPLWNTAHNNSTHRLSWFLYLACQLYLVCQKWSPLSHVWKSYTSMKNCILGHFSFSSQFLQHDNLKNQTELQYKKHTIWLYVAVSTSATKRFLDVVKYYLQCLTDTYVACDKGYFAMTSLKHMRKRLFPGNKYRSKYCTPSPPMAAPLKSPSSRRIPSIRER